jgi:hypothetical protein
MQKPSGTVRAGGAAIDFDGAIRELVSHAARTAIEFRAVRNGLELFAHSAVRVPRGTRKEWIIGVLRLWGKIS